MQAFTRSHCLQLATLAAILITCGVVTAQPGVTYTAAVGGNVADADGDGIGDNHTAFPGCCPVFVSAGVDLSGGPGANGTVRIQIEWPLADLHSAGITSVGTGMITLHTSMGSIDSLDTLFFHGLTDQDGLLTNSDFEAPMEPVPGVTMPVFPGDGVFTFDVTSYLNADLALGNSYFSIQARVDEALLGPARGLQIRTTGTAVAMAQQPQLFVALGPPSTNFIRGDINGDGSLNLQDPVILLNYLFPSGPPTTNPCDDAADANDDGSLNLQDPIALLAALFGQPSVPLPPPAVCAPDPTPSDPLACLQPSC